MADKTDQVYSAKNKVLMGDKPMTFKQTPLFQLLFFRCLKTVPQDAHVIFASLSRSSYNFKGNLFYSKANRPKELTNNAQ